MFPMIPPPGMSPPADALPRKTWTRDELEALESTGLFDGTHFELIDGELLDKTGKKKKHVKGTKMSVIALEAVFGQEFVLQGAPIDVAIADNPKNEPEPDVLVLRRSVLETGETNQPSDVALILEVADNVAAARPHDEGQPLCESRDTGILGARRHPALSDRSPGAVRR